MKLLFLILSALVCKALGACPSVRDMECNAFLPRGQMGMGDCIMTPTQIMYNGRKCPACTICRPHTVPGQKCPSISCPTDISLRQDCGVQYHLMTMDFNGCTCDVCHLPVYNCTNLSWL
ncbi:hypothetical protein ACF0H5_007240 [Mactra antiquata]